MKKKRKIRISKSETNDRQQEIRSIGKSLLELRMKRKLTQYDIQLASGLTPKQVVDIEKGRRNFTIGSILSYLRAVQGELIFIEKAN